MSLKILNYLNRDTRQCLCQRFICAVKGRQSCHTAALASSMNQGERALPPSLEQGASGTHLAHEEQKNLLALS